MAWYWWILIGLGWLIFWALAITFFMIIIDSKYPIMGELREVRRTKSFLDKIPIPIIWFVNSLLGPATLTYFWIKTRKTLIKDEGRRTNPY